METTEEENIKNACEKKKKEVIEEVKEIIDEKLEKHGNELIKN